MAKKQPKNVKSKSDREEAERLFERAKQLILDRIAELGTSYYQIAKDTSISYAALNRFSRGESISVENLFVLLNYLGLWLSKIDEHEAEVKSKPHSSVST